MKHFLKKRQKETKGSTLSTDKIVIITKEIGSDSSLSYLDRQYRNHVANTEFVLSLLRLLENMCFSVLQASFAFFLRERLGY